MNTDLLAETLKLSPSDRLQLIEALCDTPSEADIPVTPEERTLLDERLPDLEWNPRCAKSVVRSQSSAWAAVPLTLPGLIRRAAEFDFGDRRTSGLAP